MFGEYVIGRNAGSNQGQPISWLPVGICIDECHKQAQQIYPVSYYGEEDRMRKETLPGESEKWAGRIELFSPLIAPEKI